MSTAVVTPPTGGTSKRTGKSKRRNKTGGGNTTRHSSDNNNKENIKRSGFKGQLQDSCLKGVVITDNTNIRATQYKKLMDALPTYCAEKGYEGLVEILRDQQDWNESTFFSTKPDASRWSTTMQVKVAVDGDNKPIMLNQTFITDPNLKEELWGKYERNIKFEEKRWNMCQANKRALITVIRGQLDDGTRNELDLYKGYKDEMAKKNINIISIIKMLSAICHGNADGGLSFGPYKNTVALRNVSNYVNPKVEDPHYYKAELKTKFQAVLALSGRFPYGTCYMEEMLRRNVNNGTPSPLTINDYFSMGENEKAMWEKKGNDLTVAMLWLSNSRNENMKRELRLAYSQGNTDCYPTDPEKMARLAASQYIMSAPRNANNKQRNGQNGDDPNNEGDGQSDPSKAGGSEPQETLGAHVGDNTIPNGETSDDKDEKDKEGDGSLGFHLLEPCGETSNKATTVECLLASHPIDHPIWGNCDDSVSVDSAGSAEELAGMYGGDEISHQDDNGYDEYGADNISTNSDEIELAEERQQQCYIKDELKRIDGMKNDEVPGDIMSFCENETVSKKEPVVAYRVADTRAVRSPSKAPKFYAVAHGRAPGIYSDWASCSQQVMYFSGAVYKRFNDRVDAESFIEAYNSTKLESDSTTPNKVNRMARRVKFAPTPVDPLVNDMKQARVTTPKHSDQDFCGGKY